MERELAAQLIWRRYFGDLLEPARNNLSNRIRRREDEEDVLQSMYKSFCLRQQRGEFDLSGRDALLETAGDDHASQGAEHRKEEGREEPRRPSRANRGEPATGQDRLGWELEQMDAAGPSPADAAVLNEALDAGWKSWPTRSCARLRFGGWKGSPTRRSLRSSTAPSGRSSGRLARIRDKWTSYDDGTP